MKLLLLSAEDLRAALPMREAVEATKAAFSALSSGQASAPHRVAVDVPSHAGVSLLMGAHVPEMGLAAKVVSVFPRNAGRGADVVNGLVVVLDPETGAPVALCDGTFLTAWRTGAAGGAATDLLAREDATTGAVIGCGKQARTQVLAIDCVRRLETIRIFAPRPERVRAFVDEMQPEVRARLSPAESPDQALRGADVVCAATTSHTPVFSGADLAAGAHLNGVGSFTLEMREVDESTIARARVFVDSREAALAEAGELVAAERTGATRHEDWTELGLVVAGRARGRVDSAEITFFKSVGHAVQDVAAAASALEAARSRGLGREVDL